MFHLHADMLVESGTGDAGRLAALVLTPRPLGVSALVIPSPGPRHTHHLVPVDQVTLKDDRLQWVSSAADIRSGARIDEVDLVGIGGWPHGTDLWDVGIVDPVSWPHFLAADALLPWSLDQVDLAVQYDRLPKGSVELRHRSEVVAADHVRVGQLEGLIVDDDWSVREVVLDRGHLWGRHEMRVSSDNVQEVRNDCVLLALRHDHVAFASPSVDDIDHSPRAQRTQHMDSPRSLPPRSLGGGPSRAGTATPAQAADVPETIGPAARRVLAVIDPHELADAVVAEAAQRAIDQSCALYLVTFDEVARSRAQAMAALDAALARAQDLHPSLVVRCHLGLVNVAGWAKKLHASEVIAAPSLARAISDPGRGITWVVAGRAALAADQAS